MCKRYFYYLVLVFASMTTTIHTIYRDMEFPCQSKKLNLVEELYKQAEKKFPFNIAKATDKEMGIFLELYKEVLDAYIKQEKISVKPHKIWRWFTELYLSNLVRYPSASALIATYINKRKNYPKLMQKGDIKNALVCAFKAGNIDAIRLLLDAGVRIQIAEHNFFEYIRKSKGILPLIVETKCFIPKDKNFWIEFLKTRHPLYNKRKNNIYSVLDEDLLYLQEKKGISIFYIIGCNPHAYIDSRDVQEIFAYYYKNALQRRRQLLILDQLGDTPEKAYHRIANKINLKVDHIYEDANDLLKIKANALKMAKELRKQFLQANCEIIAPLLYENYLRNIYTDATINCVR